MPKTTTRTFRVLGSGPFPIDMLRHDACWPSRESEDSGIIIRSFERGGRAPYYVTLATNRGSTPTVGRWESFGFKVVER